jgi:pyruvate dehydrogenase E1 component alpha subunit/2-oxoisovalerate dehydrogenase E1 component alpha subunit
VATSTSRPATIPAGLTRARLHEMYYYLRLTRALEERLVNLHRQGKVIGGLFRSLGQEGESVASAYALEKGDILSPLIRNLGAMLVKGAKPIEVLRQYMAKADSPTAGRELNVHFNNLDLGYLGQISHLGDMVPVMAGIALSFKMRRERRVGLVYVGDGAMSAGAFHEGVNFAAVQRLAMVIIAEHNGYSYSTPTSKQTAVVRLAEKAKAYGIPAETVDGNDVLAVYAATRQAAAAARGGAGVRLIEVVTYRRRGHAEHDDQRYQPKEEIAAWEKNDPIDRYVAQLRGSGWADAADLGAIDARVAGELDAAVAACEGEPLPSAATALTDVYAHGPAAPRLWYRSANG